MPEKPCARRRAIGPRRSPGPGARAAMVIVDPRADDGRMTSTRAADRDPAADLHPHRRDRRISHPGRRREGEGPQGRRAAGDRLRSRRTGLPHSRLIVQAAIAACSDPANHRYTPTPGLPALRNAVAEKTLRDSGFAIDAAQVLMTNGGKQAVYQAFATLLDPGDEVLLPAPYWTTYPEAITLAGGVPVPVVADESTGYLVSVEQLEAATTAAPRCCCSTRRPTPPARCIRRSRSRRSAGGPSSAGSGWSPTRSTST